MTTEALEPTLEVPPPLERGAVLAPGYEVVRHVSRGRALDVYEVWSDERRSRCAVKLLRPDCVSNERAWRRLEREGRLLASNRRRPGGGPRLLGARSCSRQRLQPDGAPPSAEAVAIRGRESRLAHLAGASDAGLRRGS